MNFSRRELWALVLLSCASLITSAWLVRPRPASDIAKVSPANHPPDNATASFADVAATLQQATSAQRSQIAQAFGDFAWVVERDRQLRTTGELRTALTRFEELLFAKTDLAGAFPGFSTAANSGLLQQLGAEDKLLDRAAAVAALRGLAVACDPSFQEELR